MLENVTLDAAEPRVVEAICVYVFPAANVVTPYRIPYSAKWLPDVKVTPPVNVIVIEVIAAVLIQKLDERDIYPVPLLSTPPSDRIVLYLLVFV